MRANILVVLLVLLLGVGASLLLIPRSGELALQKFRDRDYESARAAYEERYAAGDRSAETVMPLTRLTLTQGDVDRAIELTEAFVAAPTLNGPSAVEARELLDRLYQDAQRPGDRLENLKALADLRHSAEAYRDLAYAAGFRDRMDLKAEALARYCALKPDDVDAQQELAALLAARGDHAGAVDWLMRADDRATGHIEANSRELLMSLLIDLDREEEAFGRARRWLGENPTVADMIGLASQLAAAARPDLALRLIEPQVIGRRPVLALELTYIDLLTATGRKEEARGRLSALSDPVDDSQFGRLLGLEMNAGMPGPALAAAKARDLRLVPDWVLAGLAEKALRDGDRPFLDRIEHDLGAEILADQPVLAANIALGRGDREAAARWAMRGLAGNMPALSDRLAAIRVLDRAGRRVEAAAAFDRLGFAGLSTGELPGDQLEEVAALFVDLDRAPAGLAWFTARRQAAPSPAADQGWARLAAKAGNPSAVVEWLAAHPDLPVALLRDIAGSAAERGPQGAPLALAAAERAFARDPTPRSRLALANALIAGRRPAEALPLLQPLLAGGGADVDASYITALDGAGRSAELTRYLSAKLAAGGLSDEEERNIAFLLIDHKSYRAALPLLRRQAEREEAGRKGGGREGGAWLSAYADAAAKAGALGELADLLQARSAAGPLGDAEESLYRDTLARLGRKTDLRRYLLARAGDGRLPVDRRRELASALLALDDKAGAEQVLQRLAADQGPQSDDFGQLAYLWGPRPPAAGLDWLEARAKAAGTPAEQAAWYDRLAELGGASRVSAKLGQGGPPAEAPLKAPYIEALAAAGKGRELAEAVRDALPGETAPERLRRYARLAEQTGQRKAAAQAWTALLARKPADGDALRQLGMLAYDENRLPDAERLLRGYVARGPDDYEAYYFLGEALTALKRPTAATPFYRTALAQLRALRGRADSTVQTEANLLNRLGKVDDAVTLFEALRKRRPTDRQLKADYASMLIENGRLPEARRVLALP
ncbi:tetratricopeptide repeat protein [Azospirillum picis]|uniref:Flp pilus assembly protein TadD/lipopolysaccharide biosynthesis regulator YciM n=1 Tax=Azospirillum picis TaxID=488438 RepID=A0ABU0MM94_9PROT|nr:tetratricopeptide repeat protein [Azospirillum picis]MBP2300612.1 Flp pilus assembly protein TadD/lipopolysaccharide biosynthesis regulator YciM [Azospirillum picis]MDQ0534581.1 Flp pilus assembly protein TadD/lipopolysaccharide biosynthesis regulator YciM [Azospirillum picis]